MKTIDTLKESYETIKQTSIMLLSAIEILDDKEAKGVLEANIELCDIMEDWLDMMDEQTADTIKDWFSENILDEEEPSDWDKVIGPSDWYGTTRGSSSDSW